MVGSEVAPTASPPSTALRKLTACGPTGITSACVSVAMAPRKQTCVSQNSKHCVRLRDTPLGALGGGGGGAGGRGGGAGGAGGVIREPQSAQSWPSGHKE